jgi:Protein of unknown function (DUF732)
MTNSSPFTLPLAVALGAIAVSVAPIANADSTDDTYLQGLKDAQITWPNGGDSSMVTIGKGVCKDFSNGMTLEQAAGDVRSIAPQLADFSIGKIMGVAVGAYCPQYKSKFD